MYYPNSPRKQVPLALSGVKSRKLSSLPTEDTAVSAYGARATHHNRKVFSLAWFLSRDRVYLGVVPDSPRPLLISGRHLPPVPTLPFFLLS